MKIAITGSHGYEGRYLMRSLKENAIDVIGIDRSLLYKQGDKLQEQLAGCDVVINLAGSPILRHWTRRSKNKIYNSRIITTRNLVSAINALPEDLRPKQLMSISAIGVYTNNERHTEESRRLKSDFLGKLVQDWEKEVYKVDNSVRVTIFRLGVVLGLGSQIMRQLSTIFNIGIGGKIASGNQPFLFVHIDDVVNAFLWAIGNPKSGIYNLVSSHIVDNLEMTRTLSYIMHRPALLGIPNIALRLFFGKAATLLTQSPLVASRKILNDGFIFKYDNLENAFRHSLAS